MLTDDLFERILLHPAKRKADTLYVVSGYASATMAHRHIQELREIKRRVRVELIVGMAALDGISAKDHEAFKSLVSDSFICRYVAYGNPVHSKVFSWYQGDTPLIGFTGSANYSRAAFSINRREAMIEHDAEEGRDYFDIVRQDTVDCLDGSIPNLITIYSEPEYSIRMANEDSLDSENYEDAINIVDRLEGFPHQSVSLLDNRGRLPQRSGLNWGQRPEVGREPNQAYIRLPVAIARTDFFPPRCEQFTIITDEQIPLVCVRAQDQAKAIHTSLNNSHMGIYFRHRLGIPEGRPIPTEALVEYGRTDIDFYKIDETTYYMDFST